jgi:RDD family
MTGQDTGGNAPEGGGPPGGEPRLEWRPMVPPPPPAQEPPRASPSPWPAPAPLTPPASAAAPVPGYGSGGTWSPAGGGGGRYAVPGAPGLEYAGALPRFAAFVLDMFLVGIVAAIVAFPFGLAVTEVTWTNDLGAAGVNQPTISGWSSLVSVILGAAYFTLLWMGSGRATLGMRLFNLQVGRAENGLRLHPQAALVRWLAFGSWLGLLGFVPGLAGLGGLAQLVWSFALLVSTVTSPTHQGFHDRLAGSAMVRPAGAGNGLAITCLVIVLIAPLLVVISLLALTFLGGQVSSVLSNVGTSI